MRIYIYIARPSRPVHPVAVVVLCPSVRPVVHPAVVVRPLSGRRAVHPSDYLHNVRPSFAQHIDKKHDKQA